MYRRCILWYFTCSLIFVSVHETAQVSEPSLDSSSAREPVSKIKRKWISQIFHDAEAAFDMDTSEVSEECRRDFKIYEQHADNQTVWAIRMMESSEWPRLGILSGVTTFLGNWRECLRSRGPSGVQGQYCLADATYEYSFAAANPRRGWIEWPQENASAWNIIKTYDTIPLRISRRELSWALCIPSSCKAADLQKSLTNTLRPLFETYGLDIAVDVNPINCRIQDSINIPYSSGFSYTVLIFTFLILLVMAATTFHVRKDESNAQKEDFQEESMLTGFLMCFSAVKTWKALTKHSPYTYTQLYAIKFISIILIIIAHQSVLSLAYPRHEAEESEMMFKPWNIGFGFAAVVDIFIILSGFFTFHFGLTPTKNHGVIFLIMSLIFRWLRLIPTLGAGLLLFMYVLPYLGDGPFWNSIFMNEVKHCRSTSWTALFAANNIVDEDRMCLVNTWYVAADMQLAVLGSVLLLVLSRSRKIGIILMILTFLGGTAATFITIYLNNYSGMPIPVVVSLEKIRLAPQFRYLHSQMYPKIGSYMMGCTIALLIESEKGRKYRLPWWQKNVLLTLVTTIGFGLQLYAFLFWEIGRPYDPVENAIYGSLHKVFFVMPIGFYIYLHFLTGDVPILDHFLSMKIFLPLGRLSYCAYVISFPLQIYQSASLRQLTAGAGVIEIGSRVMSDIGYSFLIAFFFYLLTEGPINNLLHMLEANVTRRLKSRQTVHSAKSHPKESQPDTTLHKDRTANGCCKMNGKTTKAD